MKNKFNILKSTLCYTITKEVVVENHFEDSISTKTKVIETIFNLPSRSYSSKTKDFLHALEKSDVNVDHLKMEQKIVEINGKKNPIPHLNINSEYNASSNFTSNYDSVLKTKNLFNNGYTHMNVDFKYFGQPKQLTSYLDVSNFLMHVEPVLTPNLLNLMLNCGSHSEAAACMFITIPGLSGDCIANISKALKTDPINYAVRPDVIQLDNFLVRVDNKDLTRTYYELSRALRRDIFIDNKSAFIEAKIRLEEITVRSYEIVGGEKILVFESDKLGIFEKNHPLS